MAVHEKNRKIAAAVSDGAASVSASGVESAVTATSVASVAAVSSKFATTADGRFRVAVRSATNDCARPAGAALFAMAVGCSPSDVHETPFEGDFRKMERVLATGRGCWSYSLGERIAALPDEDVRRRCLERYRGIALTPETERADYNLMRNRSGGREGLVEPWLDAARRCGVSLSERMEFRMAFIDWLKAERRRIVDSGVSPDDGRRPGLHITAGVYVEYLGSLYFINLWRMELQFDEEAERECRPDELKRLRARLEVFLGRLVRTREQILHDRRESSRRNMEYIESLRTSNPLPEPSGWDD